MFIQVGYGLEGVLPDARCKQIVENEITPRFRAGDFQGGQGRVFVDGKEWAAQLEGSGSLSSGMKVVVVSVSGSRLTVRPG